MTTLAGLALLFGAAICFALGAKLLLDTKKRQSACTAPATAELLRYDEEIRTETDEDVHGDTVVTKHTLHYPVFGYEAQGARREARLNSAVSKDTWAVGALVPIRCNPQRPEEFVIAGDKNANALGVAVLAAGALCLAFGAGMLGR